MHRLCPSLLALCAALCAAAPAPLRAQHAAMTASAPATDQSVEQARQLFAEGLHFVEHEDWVQAEVRFRRVLSLRSSQVVSYNLASALVHLGRLVEGSELLRGIARDPAADATTHAAAKQLLSEVEPRIASLTIRLSGSSSGTSISIDDKPLAFSGQVQTISVDPGEHRVLAHRDGTLIADQSVRVGGVAPLQAELALALPPRVSPEAVAGNPREQPILPATASSETDIHRGGRPLLSNVWLWAGVGAVILGGVATALIVSGGGKAAPVSGDTSPPVIRGQVHSRLP